jgi:hypothetical protein
MRYHEIRARPAAPNSHAFTTDLTIAPSAFGAFERAMEKRRDVRLLCRIDHPNAWCIHVACASEMVRRRLLDAWG